eukprot:2765356-Rhodomonas_salina.2
MAVDIQELRRAVLVEGELEHMPGAHEARNFSPEPRRPTHSCPTLPGTPMTLTGCALHGTGPGDCGPVHLKRRRRSDGQTRSLRSTDRDRQPVRPSWRIPRLDPPLTLKRASDSRPGAERAPRPIAGPVGYAQMLRAVDMQDHLSAQPPSSVLGLIGRDVDTKYQSTWALGGHASQWEATCSHPLAPWHSVTETSVCSISTGHRTAGAQETKISNLGLR